MATGFLGEIRMFGFTYPPRGWAFCNGQLLPINQNQALFSILGTTYGGNGQTSFQLPNLQSRVPVHVGPQTLLGQVSGEAAHTLTTNEIPQHTHTVNASAGAVSSGTPAGNYLTSAASDALYTASANANGILAPLANAGSSQAHENMQPYLAVSFCIALAGIFPSRN